MRNISGVGRDCCGCGACAPACATGAIGFKQDAEGFYVSVVREDKCVGCSKCLKVCPQINAAPGSVPQDVWAAYSKDEDVLSRSSSGGLFSVAANAAVGSGGTVYGAVLDEKDWTVSVKGANAAAISEACGSKYVQSLPFAEFNDLSDKLKSGEKVFFSGCPCQVAAVKSFVGDGEEARNLTTMDIICHGTPSPLAFKSYISWLSKKENAPISRYRFRTKERGWGMTLSYKAGSRERYKASILDRYNYNFLAKNDYRECCYKCRYAVPARQGDITVGDYWGVLGEHPEFYSEKGVSMILVNTEAGKALFEKMKPAIEFIPSSFERAQRHNENLSKPSVRPSAREGFYDGILAMPEGRFAQERMKVRPDPKSVVKALIPWRLKKLAQKLLRARRAK